MIQQFFTESLLLTFIGCVAGLLLAWASLQTLISILPSNVPRMENVEIDGRVLAFTVLISLLTGITFGLAPAWQGAQTDLNATLKGASRSNSGGIGRARTRNTLVVTQVGLSLVLLVAAGLLLKSFIALRSVDPGFDPQNVLSLRINLPRAEKYGNEQKRSSFYERFLAELNSLPGVESAAAVYPVPFSLISNQPFSVPGRPVNPAEQLSAQYNIVSPDYFHALRIRITQGRAFTERDRVGSPAVAIVNETLAQRMWPGENPLGKRLGLGRDQCEVVGVFADIKQRQLDTEPRLQICVPVLQQSSRFITGKFYVYPKTIDLVPVLEAAIETIRPEAAAKGTSLEVKLDPKGAVVSGDSHRLQQAFLNLLSNAIKFTPQGGHVNVRLKRTDSEVEISVSDTGKRISPEFLPEVFERFRQADNLDPSERGGLGLGLAIVNHIVELHQGTVRAQSPGEGKGSTFTVTLPRQDLVVLPTTSPSESESTPVLTGLRLLVVDDHEDSRELFATVLRQFGAEVRLADSVPKAVEAFDGWRPDLLVSDLSMPGDDGYSLIRKVRALAPGQGGQIPAIALTGHASEEQRRQAISAGFQIHLAKPVEPTTLVEVIATLTKN